VGGGEQRQLLRSAYLLTGELHRAEDLVQEALVKVALRWSRLRTGNPVPYARTIIVHDNISWWRRHRRELTRGTAGEAPRCRPTRRPPSSYDARWTA
jgi:DNA-directed RNA polymerase specialized sigma24 family protein